MPANKSTRVLTMNAIRVFQKYSATNKEVENAIGKAINKASSEQSPDNKQQSSVLFLTLSRIPFRGD